MNIVINIPGNPVSTNHLYSTVGRRRVLNQKAKAWKSVVAVEYQVNSMAQHGRVVKFENKLFVLLEYYFKDNRRRDVTNYDKAILDALTGIAYNDDSQITACLSIKRKWNEAGTKITICDLNDYDFIMDNITISYKALLFRAQLHRGGP